MLRIPEIELAFSNACTANCYICSPVHGGDNYPLMTKEVFDKCVSDMKEISFDTIQTGGDGDSFLNPIYIDALRILRREFPSAKIVLYSNFEMLTPKIADILIGENLLTEIYTRIDSLDLLIFRLCTHIDPVVVFENIDYFISKNRKISFQINYSSIKDYYNKCRKVLGIDPVNWKDKFYDAQDDEHFAIMNRFEGPKHKKITQSLWAERHNPALKPDPEMNCQRTYCFSSTCYIWTDGDIGICGYDDGQDTMIIGNVLQDSISHIWSGERRMQMIKNVEERRITGYPCINPKCCLFY